MYRSLITIITYYRKVVLAAIAITFPVSAQHVLTGNQLWSSAVAEKTFQTGIKIKLEQQLRLRDHSPLFSQTFTELRLRYALAGHIAINGHYRYILYSHDTGWRIAASTTIKSASGRTSHSLRLKYQRQQREGRTPVYHVRFRGTISLPSANKNVVFYLQGEPWLLLGDQQDWIRYRLDTGAKYRFSKRCTWDIFYRFQGDRLESGWSGFNILGLRLKTGL